MTTGNMPRAPDDLGAPSEPAVALRRSVLDAISTEIWPPTVRVANQRVIAKIENQLAAIAAKFLQQEEISVVIITKKSAARSAESGFEYEAVERLVKFPGRTAQETWRFSKSAKGVPDIV